MVRSADTVVQLLMSRPVVELCDIRQALDNASRATAFRYLEGIQYRRSYDHNGRYYTLYDAGKHDRLGLWSHGDVHFSHEGSLQATVTRLVQEGEAGYSQRELQEILRVRVQSFLLAGVQRHEIAREVVENLFIYLHIDEGVQKAQLERRRDRLEARSESGVEVSHEMVIQVLLVLIRHPGCKPADVARRLRGHSPPVRVQQVDSVFTRYGLGEKGGL